jgi:AcrR family transcriptional regulator
MNEANHTSRHIYETALRILEAEGPQAVTMRRVAKEVGITAMAIYHHFPNREALLSKVVDTEFEHLVEFFARSLKKRAFESQMIHMLDGYMDYAFAHPRIFDYVFSSPRPGARRFPDDFRARRSPTLNPIADALASWMKSGELRCDDVWELALQLWAHTHGYLMLYRAGRFSLSPEEFRKLVHRSLRRMLYGLTA